MFTKVKTKENSWLGGNQAYVTVYFEDKKILAEEKCDNGSTVYYEAELNEENFQKIWKLNTEKAYELAKDFERTPDFISVTVYDSEWNHTDFLVSLTRD